MTEADRKRMGKPHAELIAALQKAPFPDLSNGNPDASVQDIRHNRASHLAKLRHLYPIPGPISDEVHESEYQIPVRDGSTIRVRVYVPTKSTLPIDQRPLIIMFHEGGWRMGDLTDEDLNCRMFSRDLGAVCVNVEYRLAPEYRFPHGVNDAYDSVKWCAAEASPSSNILPCDPAKGFLVGGASAGGNFAAIMCQIARDESLSPPLTGQYLCVPALCSQSVAPEGWKAHMRSRDESADDPVLQLRPNRDQERLEVLRVEADNPLYSPLLHKDLTRLPPAFFQLGGLDPLRDEALVYAEILKENNTPTSVQVYDGFGHMFWTNWPTMERSKQFVQDTLEGVKWLLSGPVTSTT